eukprot:jgi/Chlat1/6858/Chrsp51S00510
MSKELLFLPALRLVQRVVDWLPPDLVAKASSEPYDWMLSATASMVTCILVFWYSQHFTSLFFTTYRSLPAAERCEWDSRVPSTVHAIFITAAAYYCFFESNVFVARHGTKEVLQREDSITRNALGVSLGYFAYDLWAILRNYPHLGGKEFIFHHGIALMSVLLGLITKKAHYYVLMLLATELTTPFVNARWYFAQSGMRDSGLYTINGVMLFISWLVGRIVLFGYLFWHIYDHRDEVKHLWGPAAAVLMVVPPVLGVLNVYWFAKITLGVMKLLSGGSVEAATRKQKKAQ